MRVGFFHPRFAGVGGAENLIAAQAQYLRSVGLDVSLISRMRAQERWRGPLEGVALHPFSSLPVHLSDFYRSRTTRLIHNVAATEAALEHCDVVVGHNFPSCTLLGAAAIRGKRIWYCNEPHRQLHLLTANPYLTERVTTHRPNSAAEHFYARKLALYRFTMSYDSRKRRLREFDRAKTSQIELILANSEYTRDNIRKTYGRSDAHVVYPMVRLPPAGKSRTGIDRSRGLQVLAHSRFDVAKNLDHVLRGFALHVGRRPGAQLHIVGVGAQRRKLMALSQRLGIGEWVRFHGFLPQAELERVYDACDVFALTPLDEPFGMVFPEAAARGLLMIGPDHGGPCEILDHGRLGLVCDPFEPESLADALERVAALSDGDADAQRTRMSDACRSRFSVEAVGPQLARAVQGSSLDSSLAIG